ncbi:MAG: hypothetical protein ACK55I_24565, partial [bacterium]
DGRVARRDLVGLGLRRRRGLRGRSGGALLEGLDLRLELLDALGELLATTGGRGLAGSQGTDEGGGDDQLLEHGFSLPGFRGGAGGQSVRDGRPVRTPAVNRHKGSRSEPRRDMSERRRAPRRR